MAKSKTNKQTYMLSLYCMETSNTSVSTIVIMTLPPLSTLARRSESKVSRLILTACRKVLEGDPKEVFLDDLTRYMTAHEVEQLMENWQSHRHHYKRCNRRQRQAALVALHDQMQRCMSGSHATIQQRPPSSPQQQHNTPNLEGHGTTCTICLEPASGLDAQHSCENCKSMCHTKCLLQWKLACLGRLAPTSHYPCAHCGSAVCHSEGNR